MSSLLGTPAQSNAMQYNCSAIKSTFMFRFYAVVEVLVVLCNGSIILSNVFNILPPSCIQLNWEVRKLVTGVMWKGEISSAHIRIWTILCLFKMRHICIFIDSVCIFMRRMSRFILLVVSF